MRSWEDLRCGPQENASAAVLKSIHKISHTGSQLSAKAIRLVMRVDGHLDCDKFRNNYTLFKERHMVTPYYNPRATVTDKANNIIFPIMPHVREMRIMKRSRNYEENLFTRTTCRQEVIDLLSDEETKEEDEK